MFQIVKTETRKQRDSVLEVKCYDGKSLLLCFPIWNILHHREPDDSLTSVFDTSCVSNF